MRLTASAYCQRLGAASFTRGNSELLAQSATHFGKAARLVDHEGDRSELSFSSRWVLVSGDATFFDQPALQAAQAIEPRAGFVPWRDDYSSLLSVLK